MMRNIDVIINMVGWCLVCCHCCRFYFIYGDVISQTRINFSHVHTYARVTFNTFTHRETNTYQTYTARCVCIRCVYICLYFHCFKAFFVSVSLSFSVLLFPILPPSKFATLALFWANFYMNYVTIEILMMLEFITAKSKDRIQWNAKAEASSGWTNETVYPHFNCYSLMITCDTYHLCVCFFCM